MTLTKTFRNWRRNHPDGKIVKLEMGDDNLIAELSKHLKTKKIKYKVASFIHNDDGTFKIVTLSKYLDNRTSANRKFKKIVEEF